MEGVAQRFEGLQYNGGFGNGFETEVLQGTIPKCKFLLIKTKTVQLFSRMEYLLNSCLEQLLQSKEQKTNEHGCIK